MSDLDKLENIVLKSSIKEREISDDKYAPMVIKTIVFSFLGLLVIGVLYGISDTFKKRTEKFLNPEQPVVVPTLEEVSTEYGE